jgi:hypothetical protein
LQDGIDVFELRDCAACDTHVCAAVAASADNMLQDGNDGFDLGEMLYSVLTILCVPAASASADHLLQDGNDVFDLGETLYSFLVRFGDDFDVHRVSAGQQHAERLQRCQLA